MKDILCDTVGLNRHPAHSINVAAPRPYSLVIDSTTTYELHFIDMNSLDSMYERQFDTLKKIIDRQGIAVTGIVEAGARDCIESLVFKRHFPAAAQFAFECSPAQIEICKKNIEGTNITLIEKALSDTEGFMDFYVVDTPDHGSSSAYKHKDAPAALIKVPVTTLQKELAHLPFPTVMWIDSQGSELAIFKGCGERIKEVGIIHTEVYFKPAYIGQPTYRDIRTYLQSKGFRLVCFTNSIGNFGDAIFCNVQHMKWYVPAPLIEFNEFFIKKVARRIKRIFHIHQ